MPEGRLKQRERRKGGKGEEEGREDEGGRAGGVGALMRSWSWTAWSMSPILTVSSVGRGRARRRSRGVSGCSSRGRATRALLWSSISTTDRGGGGGGGAVAVVKDCRSLSKAEAVEAGREDEDASTIRTVPI